MPHSPHLLVSWEPFGAPERVEGKRDVGGSGPDVCEGDVREAL